MNPLLLSQVGCSSACSSDTEKGSKPSGGMKEPAITSLQLASLFAQVSKAFLKEEDKKMYQQFKLAVSG